MKRQDAKRGAHGRCSAIRAELQNLCFLVCSMACLAFFDGRAAAEPSMAALRSTSVILKWTEIRTVGSDEGDSDETSLHQYGYEVKAYVSDQSRVFSTLQSTKVNLGKGRRRLRVDKDEAGVSGESEQTLHWRFDHGALVADHRFRAGAMRVSVTFSDDLSHCSLDLIYGKKQEESRILLKHAALVDVSIGDKSCEVQKGNIFAP